MQVIVATIKPGETGVAVANLQDAILALLGHQLIKALDAPNRPTKDELMKLADGLKHEREGSNFREATQQLIRFFQIQQGLGDNLNGVVEDKTAVKLNEILKSLGLLDGMQEFTVAGTIGFVGIRPEGSITAIAFDRDLRTRQRLGAAVIDTNGKYRIVYSKDATLRAEAGSADVFVEVHDIDDNVLATSDTVFNAPPQLTVDLTVPGVPPREPSEYEKLLAVVLPLLKGQGQDLTIAELTADDQAFVVRETGWPADQIAILVTAARAELLTSPSITIPVAAYYGWFRDGQPQSAKQLRQMTVDALLASLGRAQAKNIIPFLGINQEIFSSTLFSWLISALLEPALAGEPPSLGDIFNSVSTNWLSSEERWHVAVAAMKYAPTTPEFVAALREAMINEGDIETLLALLVPVV
jgi:hypothetical protein